MSEEMKTTAGLSIKHGAFAKPPLHIPNAEGLPYKTELVEVRSPEQTIKWNFWHAPDDDREPHNHPWKVFNAEIHHGGYSERRFWLDGNGTLKSEERSYKVGDINTCENNVFHLVFEVQPGTVSRMVCGPIVKDNEWGYLSSVGIYTKAGPDPSFIGRLKANNRFMK